MNAVLGGKIVTGWACNVHGMPMFHVHQTDYPEIEAEGQTPAEACDRLVQLLVQAIDFASEAWRCQPLRLALIDARGINRSITAGAWTEPGRPRLPSM
jgi:hypothetical protein